MRILLLAVIASAALIGMFSYLEHGDATKEKILSEEQREQLKDVMKPETIKKVIQ